MALKSSTDYNTPLPINMNLPISTLRTKACWDGKKRLSVNARIPEIKYFMHGACTTTAIKHYWFNIFFNIIIIIIILLLLLLLLTISTVIFLSTEANPTLELSVMKSNDKCNNWTLSLMHMFWYANRTCIHNVTDADMKNREFNTAYTTSLYYGVPRMKISQDMDICLIFLSESLLYEFLNLSTGGWGPHYCQPPVSIMTATNELKNGSCISPGCIPTKSDILSTGKWTKHYDWPTSFKCKSWLAVAQPQENASCWWTLSLPPDTRMHKHENDHFIILLYLHFFGIMISSWA